MGNLDLENVYQAPSIVLIDSTKKTLGYRGSCGVTLGIFQIFKGPEGGDSPKKFQFFFSLKTV